MNTDLHVRTDRQRRRRAGGDAAAFMVAQAVGHHAPTRRGVLDHAGQARHGLREAAGDALQARIGPQADCLAAAWAGHAHETRSSLERGTSKKG